MLKLKDKDSARSVWLVGSEMVCGADENCDLVLSQSSAGQHAKFLIAAEGVSIEPIDGPIKVNGKSVHGKYLLSLQDEILIAGTSFILIDPNQEQALKRPAASAQDKAPSPSANKPNEPSKGSGWMLQGDMSLDNRQYPVNGMIVLGRSPECGISLSYDRLSRRHAALKEHQGSLLLKDLGSSNGTFVNGRKIKQARLQAGDVISVEKLKLTVIGPSQTLVGSAFSSADDLNKTVIQPAVDQALVKQVLAAQKQKQAADQEAEDDHRGGVMPIGIGILTVAVILGAYWYLYGF